jgi:hypothetical protein
MHHLSEFGLSPCVYPSPFSQFVHAETECSKERISCG